MTADQEILRRIPHRPPFLWVDRIVAFGETTVKSEVTFASDLELCRGHYPGNPLIPGVILSEAIFQSGALLISHLLESGRLANEGGIPVITRIESAKFKRMVLPGERLDITVDLREIIASVCFLRGIGKVGGKTAVQIAFACAITAGRADE